MAQLQSEVIAAHNTQGVLLGTSAYGLALAAKNHAAVTGNPNDLFALRGINECVKDFDVLLDLELTMLQAQLAWIEDLGDYQSEIWSDAAHINLQQAITFLTDAQALRPTI